ASGLIPTLASISEVIPASSTVVVEGSFSGELFIATELQVVRITALGVLRRRAFSLLDRRLSAAVGSGEAKALALLLLLGQSESESFLLKDGALSCGCAHVLALSGMHLSFLITLSVGLCSLCMPKRWARRLGLVPPLGFVILAGPKPSLIRSALVRLGCEAGLSIESSAALAYLLQLWVFAESIDSLAATYSWVAFLALVLSSKLPRILGRLTALAVAATAPIALSYSGEWNVAGLLFSPPAALLISFAMLLSIAVLFGGALFAPLLCQVTALLQRLFALGQSERLFFGAAGYGVYLLLLLTLFASVGYAEAAAQRRRRQRYAVGVRIRLTEGDQGATGREGVCSDEEVWTKLSPYRISTHGDCSPPYPLTEPACHRDRPGPRGADDAAVEREGTRHRL
ncbi:MAG TPA: ComEC/Rec2 family competence protein, partial [Sphaerochaeta sp.]|nr:ComEC/Rec2 family competence protein [Sphaerochaeta sp.]